MAFDPSTARLDSTFDPDTATESPAESAPGAILRQIKAGAVVDLPKMAGQAIQYASSPGNPTYDFGKSIADAAAAREKLPENAPIDESQHGTVVNALAGGARMIPQSIVPAAVVGAGLAALPAAATAAVPAGAMLLGGAALGSLPAAMSQGQQTLDKAKEAGVSDEEALKAARLTALIEGAGETIGTAAMGKVLGVGARALSKAKTPGDMLKGLTTPSTLKPWAKATAQAYPTEIVTEMGQNAGETAVENTYGIEKKQTPWDAAKEAIAPTAGMTTLLAPFGLAGHAMAARHTQKQAAALSSPDTAPEVRAQLAHSVFTDMAELDPAVADVFAQNAADAIRTGQALPLDASALEPGSALAKSNAEMDTLNAGLTQAGNDYAGQLPPNAGLLEEKPLVVQNPTTGVVTEIDRRGGPLEQAAAIAVESGAHEVAQNVDASEILFPYANARAAQDYIGRQADPEMYDAVPHPRVEGRTAVVPKTGPARQAILDKRASDAANEHAKLRGEQLKQDESPAPTEITESIAGTFGNGSTGNVTITPQRGGGFEIRVSSSSDGATKRSSVAGFPAGTNRARAIAAATRSHGGFTKDKPVVKAKPVVDTTVADAAQDELAPPTVQPVTDMPGVQQRAKVQAQGAVATAQTRAAQLADEENIDSQAQAANPEPSEAQRTAGNYAHGHIRVGGLDISVETPAGAVRTGTDKGKTWKVKNTAHYGYVKRTQGADGEQVDVYVKPGTSSTSGGPVFVVDQYNPATGAFDEHKALLGYSNQAEAAAAYDAHFNDKSGPKRRGAVTQMSLDAFKGWLASGDTSKAVSGKRFGKVVADNEQAAQDEIARSTGKMSLPRSAQKPGESNAAFELRRAAATQAAKTARVAGQQTLPTKDSDKAAVREALGMPDDAEVSILSAESRPDAGKAKGVSKQAAQFIQQVARIFGKRVVFFDVPDRGAAEGFYVRGNTVYLNTNSSTQHLRILGHELTHAMKRQARGAYERMLGAVATLRTDEEMAAQHADYFGRSLDDVALLDQPHPGSDGTLREFLAEEWMADLGGNRFAEAEFWTSVFGRLEGQHGTDAAKGIVAKLRLALVAALNKLKTLIGGNAFAVDARLGEHLEGIRTAVAEGFAEYARLSKAGQLAEVSGEAKFKPGSDIGHKRESDGRYVGAPEWVGDNPQQLAVLRKKLLQLTLEGEPGRFWYEQSSKAILDLAKGDKDEAEKIVQLIAIYSPSAQVPGNTTLALKAYYQWKQGLPVRVGFGQADRKANALLYEGKEWKGMKTNTFYSNLMEEIDPSKNLDGATMDMWMAIAFDYGSKALDQGPKYKFAERETQRIAKRLGWSPHQVQAAIWTAMKGRVDPIRGVLTAQELDNGWYDEESQAWWASGEKAKYESRRDAALRDRAAGKRTPFARVDVGTEKLQPARRKDHYHLAHKLGLEYNLTQEDVMASKYDFSNAIRERTAQMSWEATPGETTGVLPGIHKAPMHQQQEYLVAIRKALSDEKGNDLIGKEVGLALATSVQGFSGWQGVSTVGIQDGIAVPIDSATSAVQQMAIDAINLVADIKGLVLYQEGVAWHFPYYKGSKNGQNGVEFRIGRLLTEEENANLYKGLVAALGHTYAPPIPTQDGQGFRVLNFPDEKFALMDDFGKSPEDQKRKKDLQKAQLEKNVAFIESVADVVFKQPWHAEVTDEVRFESIGELRENDWSKGDGDYRGRIEEAQSRWPQTQDRWAGRSNLLGWVEHDLRPRVAEVNRNFSERYGWGKASLSPRRGDAGPDAAGDRLDRGVGQGEVRRPVQPESVSAVGIHYSREPRGRLDSSYFGTGIQGAEVERVASAKDARIKQRIYFYVNGGRGIKPEEGVGSHTHQAQLDNLYDGDNDPLDLRVTNTFSGFESAVLDKGFDGYLTHERGIAVLLGQRNIVVEYIGQNDRPDVPQAAQAEPSFFGKQMRAVAANRGLPSGEMTGADWKRLMPKLMPDIDVSHLNDEQKYYKDEIIKRPQALAKMSTQREGLPEGFRVEANPISEGRKFIVTDASGIRLGSGETREEAIARFKEVHAALYPAVPDSPTSASSLDGARLKALRRTAAGLETPQRGVFLRVTDDGKAIASGPKGARIPEAFRRFAHDNGLTFYAERKGYAPASATPLYAGGRTSGDGYRGIPYASIAGVSEPIPISYRESGALYFGEMGAAGLDRTDKTRFSQQRDFRAEEVRNAQGKLLAPNGRLSNLDERQWHQVRTPEFKAWFGDWEAAHNGKDGNGVWARDDVSKVVDENGEPKVVYHGTEYGGFTTFRPDKADQHRSPMIFAAATWDTARTYAGRGTEIELDQGEPMAGYKVVKADDPEKATHPWRVVDATGKSVDRYLQFRSEEAAQEWLDEEREAVEPDEQVGVYSLFLNLRNPNEADFEGANWDGTAPYGMYEVIDDNDESFYSSQGDRFMDIVTARIVAERHGLSDDAIRPARDLPETTNTVAEEAKRYGNDGAIIRRTLDDGGKAGRPADVDDVFVVFDANQLKSAVGNTGTFSTKNDDIRYSVPRFVSQLARTFENAPAKLQTQPAAQWKLWLAGQQAVKKDEIAWSGINDWLDLQGKAKVSRAQIQEYLADKVTNEGLPLFSLRRALNGEHNTDDHLVPETPLYLDNPDLVDLAYANGKPIRLNVGLDLGPGKGRGALHLIASAERDRGRGLDQVTDDEGENVVRTVLRTLGSGSAQLHWQDGQRYALRIPLANKTLILQNNRDYFSIVTMLPSAENKWGTAEWAGRLTFPAPAIATTADPSDPAPAKSSQAGLKGIGYSSEKFKVTPDAPLVQSPGAAAPRIVVKVAQKKHRTLDAAAMAADGLAAKKSLPRTSVALTDDRIEHLFGQYAYTQDDKRTKAYLAWVSPDDFLRATTPAGERDWLESEKSKLDVSALRKESQDVQLLGKLEDGHLVTNGHEGRHRLMALRDAGVRKVPVVLYGYNGAQREPVRSVYVRPQKWGATRAEGGFFAGNLVPINYENESRIRSEFGGAEADIRYSPVRANLGAMTPAQAVAANNVLGSPKTFMQRLAEFRKDWAKNLKQGIFDQFAPIAELDQQAYIQARLSKGGESTLEALMLYGKLFVGADGATDVRYTRAGGKQGFAGKMSALKGEHDRFLLWVAAQRADRLQAIGLENLWTPQDIVTLKGLDQGAMKDGTARPALYAQALQDLNEFNDNVLDVAVSSGLIDDATRQMYAGTPYVPFYRLQEDDSVSGFGVKPGLVNQYAWKRLKGGTQKLNEDLLANLLHNWSHLITASAKNRAAKATLDAAATAGIAAQVPAGMPGKGHVSYKAAGQEQVFVVSDPHLFDAVAALHYAGLGPWAKPLSAAKHWLTIGVTANPAFKLRNLIRDSIGALGSAQLSYNVAGNIQQGWQATAEDNETRAHLLASGGMIRFGSMLDGQDSQRAADLIHEGVDPAMILDSDAKIKKFWKRYVHPALSAYNEFGDRTENINRAALYEQLIAKGLTNAEAAYWSRDLMDFAMAGKWTAIRTLTQTVPFFNARLQGLYKLGRAGKQDIRRLGTVLGAVSLSSLALLLAYGDDDDWKKRSDADRNNYWWFKVGGHAFRLPKPFEIGAVGTLAERGYELMFEKEMTDARFGRNMRDIVMSQLSMNPVPQLFKPMMDIYANKDSFTGRDIESMGMERLRKQDRYDEKTSEVARFLGSLGLPDVTQFVMGRWDTLSPKQIDFLARGYFSWLGTMTTTALDYGIRPMLDRGARPELQLKDVFFAGNFVESLPSNQSRYLTQLYDQAREIEQAYASYHNKLKVGDTEGARELREEEGALIKRYPATQQLKRAESLLNQQLQRINASTTLSGDEKRARLDQVYARRNTLAERFQAQ